MNNRGDIKIIQRADSSLSIEITTADNDIWVTSHEIADIFQIYVSSVLSNLKVIFKNGELHKDDVSKESNGVIYYNLDVVIALAFRCKGPICIKFREWLRDKAKKPMVSARQPLIIQIGNNSFIS
ncbi:MAG: hypothetical protein SNH16_07365 [Rikenellaceae bacterium]